MESAAQERREALAWYRHFWPWFILGLLATAVTASLVTVWIAFAHRDSLVSDDYYEDGTAINRRLELERSAQRHGVIASLAFRPGAGPAGPVHVEIALEGRELGDVEALVLELSHPTLAERDDRVLLERLGDGRYRGQLGEMPSGRWYALLEPEHGPEPAPGGVPPLPWRLTGSIQLPASGPITLGAGR